MSRQYHGRRIVHLENASERAEREEQRFRRRHDRLHRMRLLHSNDPNRTDVADGDDLADADVLEDCQDDE